MDTQTIGEKSPSVESLLGTHSVNSYSMVHLILIVRIPIVMKHYWETNTIIELVVGTHLGKSHYEKYPLLEEDRRTQLPPELYLRGENPGYSKGGEKDSGGLKTSGTIGEDTSCAN